MQRLWLRFVRVALPMALTSIFGFACTTNQSSSSQKVTSVHKVVSAGSASFVVAIPDGRLDFVPGSPGQVSLQGTVTYRGDRAPTLLWQEGTAGLSLLSICHSVNKDCGYDYTFAVPLSMAVTATNTAGDLSVRGLTGSAQLVALAGDVTLADLSGTINVLIESVFQEAVQVEV